MGTRAHACLLVRINRHHRLPRPLTHCHTAVEGAKWGRTIGRRRPLSCLARALEARVQVGSQRRHGGMADLMPLARKRRGPCAWALPGPAPRRHRIAPGRRVHQRFQRGDQGRIMGLERCAPASRVPHPPAGRTRRRRLVTPCLTPTAHRPLPQARGLGDHLDPAVPQCERFAGRPAAASALMQLRRKAGELSSQDFSKARVYHVINGV